MNTIRQRMSLMINNKSMFDLLCSFIWTRYVIILFIIIGLNRLVNHEITDIIITVVTVLLAVLAIPYMIRKLKFRDIVFYLIFVGVYIFSMRTNEAIIYSYLDENLVTMLFRYAPLYLVGVCITDKETVDRLHVVSLTSIFVNVLFIAFAARYLNQDTDYMSFSYYILPHICLVLFYAAKEKSIWDILASFLGILSIIIYGTRGPFPSIALIFLLYFLFYKKYKHKFISRVVAFILISAVYLLIIWFLIFYGPVLSQIVLRTKILDNLTLSGFFFDNGRFEIFDVVMGGFAKDPLAVRGFAADRILTNSYGNLFHYSHNLVLEMLYSFGIIVGGAALINLFVNYFKGYYRCPDQKVKGLILILLCSNGLFKLLISSSFMLEPLFFLTIGICVAAVRAGEKPPKLKLGGELQ